MGWQVSDTLFPPITLQQASGSLLPRPCSSTLLTLAKSSMWLLVLLVPQFSGTSPEKAAGAKDGTAQRLPSGPPTGQGESCQALRCPPPSCSVVQSPLKRVEARAPSPQGPQSTGASRPQQSWGKDSIRT